MIAEASFNGIVRTLVIMILVYYAIKFLIRIFAPMLIQQVVKKAGENMHAQQQQYYNKQQDNNQDYYNKETVANKPREKKKVGEYIDYEEID